MARGLERKTWETVPDTLVELATADHIVGVLRRMIALSFTKFRCRIDFNIPSHTRNVIQNLSSSCYQYQKCGFFCPGTLKPCHPYSKNVCKSRMPPTSHDRYETTKRHSPTRTRLRLGGYYTPDLISGVTNHKE